MGALATPSAAEAALAAQDQEEDRRAGLPLMAAGSLGRK